MTELTPQTKKVLIVRKEQHSHVPVEIRQTGIHRLGSVYNKGATHKGVSNELEKKLLPLVNDIPASSNDFRKEAKDYWRSLTVKVPSEGTELNLDVDSDGDPVEPKDYLTYEWAKTHPSVAMSKSEMLGNHNKKFYIHDPERETDEENERVQTKAKAMKEFVKVLDDEDAVDRVLRVMSSTNPAKMNKKQKENKLHALVDSDPKRFYDVATDTSLKVKDFIAELLEKEILRQSGNSYFYMDESIGDSLDEAVAYMKNKKNSSAINDMQAKLKERRKTTPVS